MKRPSTFVRDGSSTDMNSTMTPMIDVVFLLLVFFVWTASFTVIEQTLRSDMTAEVGAQQVNDDEPPPPEDDFEKVVVRIKWDGTAPVYTINDEVYDSMANVQNQLQAIAEVKNDSLVILHPDGIVPLGFVIEVYDSAKVVGFEKVSFSVNPAQQVGARGG